MSGFESAKEGLHQVSEGAARLGKAAHRGLEHRRHGKITEVGIATRLRSEGGFSAVAMSQCSITPSLSKLWWSWHENPEEDFSVHRVTNEHSIPGITSGGYLGNGEVMLAHMQNSGGPNAGDGDVFNKVYGLPSAWVQTLRGFGEESLIHREIAERSKRLARIYLGDKNLFGSEKGTNLTRSLDRFIAAAKRRERTILFLPRVGFEDELPRTDPNRSRAGYREVNLELKAKKGTLKEDYFEREEVSRGEAMQEITARHPFAARIYGNGYNSREGLGKVHRPGNFYNAGYMGGGAALGYGLAKTNPDIEVVVIDGNENWNMGSPMHPVLEDDYPENLHIYVLDNGGAASVDGGVPSIPVGQLGFNLAHVIPIEMDDSSTFKEPRVESIIDSYDADEQSLLLAREIGPLKYHTREVRQFIDFQTRVNRGEIDQFGRPIQRAEDSVKRILGEIGSLPPIH